MSVTTSHEKVFISFMHLHFFSSNIILDNKSLFSV